MFCYLHGDMGPQTEPPHTCPVCDGRRKVLLQGFFAIYHADGRLYYTTTHPISEADIHRETLVGRYVRKIEQEEVE